ncbi:MAG: DNA topoisomerase IB [Ilumatobacteraceae bacterium]
MVRLRHVAPDRPGWSRRRRGAGFSYVDVDGRVLGAEDVARCKALVIPPAWADVWICPAPNGHIQAVGTDEAGRRQYLYHPVWREQRDKVKHDRVLEVATRLPRARRTVREHIALPGMPRERALGTAFRLLDLGFFRVGGEHYAEENGSFGLATIAKRDVTVKGDEVVFEYVAKSHQERLVAVADAAVRDAVCDLRRRRGGGDELLAYRDGSRWRDVTSDDINRYVKDVVGGDVSAKDFRTWHGTVLAAVALAGAEARAASPTRRKRAVREAMVEVSQYLGNTPSVARGSYVDPRLVDLYAEGRTIAPTLRRLGTADRDLDDTREVIERAVLRLLRR